MPNYGTSYKNTVRQNNHNVYKQKQTPIKYNKRQITNIMSINKWMRHKSSLHSQVFFITEKSLEELWPSIRKLRLIYQSIFAIANNKFNATLIWIWPRVSTSLEEQGFQRTSKPIGSKFKQKAHGLYKIPQEGGLPNYGTSYITQK